MNTATDPSTATDALAKRLWALGDLARLRLLSLLPTSPDCTTRSNVSSLAEALGLSQPTVSHHLRVLRQAGFVEFRKMCRDVYYWRSAASIDDVARNLVEQLGDGPHSSLDATVDTKVTAH